MTITATITLEIEVTVEAGIDQHGFDVVSIAAVNGYDATRKTWKMTDAFKPEQLAELVEKHFGADAQSAIDEQAGEEREAYLDGQADRAYERSMGEF